MPNGDLSVTWSITPDPGNQFQSYNVFTSTSASGPFTPKATITNYNTNNTLCSVANAQNTPYFVYVTTNNQSGVQSPPLDTVRSIYLSNLSDQGHAIFKWLNPFNPMPQGEGTYYYIYREYPAGSWKRIDSVAVAPGSSNYYTYRDTINICGDTMRYKAVLYDSLLHCSSVSSIVTGYFKDVTPPHDPSIDSVSIQYNGSNEEMIMGIHHSTSGDTHGYVVYLHPAGSNTTIATLYSYTRDTSYIYTGNQLAQGSQNFNISAIDTCGNNSIHISDQNTIYATASSNKCKKQNTISWTAYQHMVTGVHHYEVYSSVAGLSGPYTSIGTSTTTSYIHANVANNTNYAYFVRAHSNGKKINGKDTASSSSNRFAIVTSSYSSSQLLYENNVTVNPQENVDVEWYSDTASHPAGFNIYRAESKAGPYNLLHYTAAAYKKNYSFTDEDTHVKKQEYFYFIQTLDSCSNPSIHSDTSNTIVLQAVPTPDLTATLTWNDFSRYAGGVSNYEIYRSVNNNYSFAGSVPAGTNTFVDDVSPFTDYEGHFVYYVQAVEGAVDGFGFHEKSQSNYAEVYVDARVLVPNTFTPNGDGRNEVFIPVGNFVDATEYKLSIYDRWGQKFFETNDMEQGWDGKGREPGLYVYHIDYKSSLGEYKQANGTITLIK